MAKKFLVWLDILGFVRLAREIATESHLTERKVRSDFANVIRQRVDAMETKGEIIGKNYGDRDDWILVTASSDSVFKIISEILTHNTGYDRHEKIPLEIAIGTGEYDKWARFDGSELIAEDSTLEFLKTDIIGFYHTWHGSQCGESPKSTFVILTESAYRELAPLDRRQCKKIEHNRDDETISFFVVDVDSVQQRGKLFEFLEKINRPSSKLYDRIDDMYVRPLEYRTIERALRTKRLVFITGTREYGKTYTAVRLLWDFFLRGYEPVWIEGGEVFERLIGRRRLEEIEKELRPHQIVYFEDPFGKKRYERRESLERGIGTIVDCVHNTEDVYVIVTSREEIFKQFEEEHLSSVVISKFEKKLNVKRPSYDYARRKRMLLKWAESKDCKWLGDRSLRNAVLKQMRHNKLPTPLSIRDFAIATAAISEKDVLLKKIEEKSKETARSFAEEIEDMTDDKILFLSFPFVSDFPVELVRKGYVRLVKALAMKESWDFERMVGWFREDKISIDAGRVKFSHASYSEALDHLLVQKGRLTRINRHILSRVLLRLSENNTTAWALAIFVIDNFGRLPQKVRDLLFRLSENNATSRTLAYVVADNFGKLPREVANHLLLELSGKDANAGFVAWTVVDNYDSMPKKVRDLLFRLSENNTTAWAVACVVADNFGKLPREVANHLLLELSGKDATAEDVAWAVVGNYDRLPKKVKDELLLRLWQHPRARVIVDSDWAAPRRYPYLIGPW